MSNKTKHSPAPIPQPQLVKQERTVTTSWKGPVPDPASLSAYKNLLPDAPERILSMAEDEARARRELEQKDHESINRTKELDVVGFHASVMRGQWMAFVILLSSIIGSGYCASIGNTTTAVTLAGVGLANIAAQFIHKWKK